MNADMACRTDGNLLPVQCAQNTIKSRCYPFVGKFADVSNVVHCGLLYLTADAARLTKLGACSHPHCRLYQVNIRVFSFLESISSFGPVMIEVEADLAVFLSIFSGYMDGHLLPEALEYFGHGDLVFSRQGLGK